MLTQQTHRKNRAALTRAINSGDPAKVIAAATAARASWEGSAWPDDWSRWQRALDDLGPMGQWHRINLDDLV